jgi:hypothetical protein
MSHRARVGESPSGHSRPKTTGGSRQNQNLGPPTEYHSYHNLILSVLFLSDYDFFLKH